ncbi:MAG: helix-turn-helix domain-containing protein [Clostridia bacterium]|nr:helix-turn-helix domain-containing protein [Clostridia bacterium]MBQ5581033.1 helix-turn-helix domain-containing protein [Clostridia bacterium]MBQ8083892.1 helix-turn-helix domain-containing protein [Clostridia bacterium]MBQ8926406.1 helix-turn-helix domain-containing protein [Clostridia bacterium]
MSYTKYGEFLRIQRIKHQEVMGDTAKLLDVSVPFVSAVENGKKSVPAGWYETIVAHYNLDVNEQKELRESIEQSKPQIRIDLKKVDGVKREMAVQFQRSFENIDEETALKIVELLNGGK